ncbi:MAG: AAA family ATPase [Oligoflexia bacterium]|nr:AAA family ATPase [Oligoflexia bacterium]
MTRSKELVERELNLPSLLAKKSYFLLGPRQTGKTSLIRQQLAGVKVYNLLLKEVFQKLSFNPAAIREELTPRDQIIVIDEIQKLPDLLDEVQYLIEEKGTRFLLTGSSARKLMKYGTNLLGGRARIQMFHPFTRRELGARFELERTINYGLLPSVYFSDDPEADLEAYLGLYLQQEIANEGLTRNLPAFSRFLEVAALCNAEQVDFTRISNDAQVARTTVHEYFQVLQDTLIAHEVPAWRQAKKRKPVSTSKFYFFDWGVVRKLQHLGEVRVKSPNFGKAFESYLFHELKTYCDYKRVESLSYWRTQAGDEVDFILGDEVAIEVKAKATVDSSDLKGLRRLKEEKRLKRYFLVYAGPTPKRLQPDTEIEIVGYEEFLDRLWDGEIL